MINIQNILNENSKRLQTIHTPYDPLIGTEFSNIITRKKLSISDAPYPVQYIPSEMEKEDLIIVLHQQHTLAKAAKAIFGLSNKHTIVKTWQIFPRLRCRYDFEYWAATQIKIKLKGYGHRDYFILNRAQRYYLSVLEKLRKSGTPIYIVLLKARQWGGSTLTQFYMMWIQKMHRKHWNSVIVGDIEKQSKVVLAMYENACQDYDTFIDDGTPTVLKPYGRTNDIRILENRNCTISVGSMQKPDKIRSEDISMAHFTEFGMWKTTDSKSPEDVMQTIEGTILYEPYTLWVIESTAKGVGNAFHNIYTAAKSKSNNFIPVFVPWYMIDIYSKPITLNPTSVSKVSEPDAYPDFINSLSEYEWQLWELGATLEAINWYRTKSKGTDEWRMKSEFPSTDFEAFQSTGRMYFKEQYLKELYDSCTEPIITGEIVSTSNSKNKTDYLSNLRIEPNDRGHLKVWADVDNSVNMQYRYLVCVDLGKGSSTEADNTIVCVFDRYWQQETENGYPEVVAEWAGKESETDLLAWRIAQIASYYNNALLVIESNTIDSSREDRFRAILDEIKDYFPNLYKRPIKNTTDVGSTGAFRYGWNTNHKSKEKICAYLDWALREGMYVERCKDAVDEMKIFERHEDGSLGNVKGKNNHDDRVITRAMGMYFCYKVMPLPSIYSPSEKTTHIQTSTSNMVI